MSNYRLKDEVFKPQLDINSKPLTVQLLTHGAIDNHSRNECRCVNVKCEPPASERNQIDRCKTNGEMRYRCKESILYVAYLYLLLLLPVTCG